VGWPFSFNAPEVQRQLRSCYDTARHCDMLALKGGVPCARPTQTLPHK